MLDSNNRWPNYLARRLATGPEPMAVLNLGIGGNRLLSDGGGISALARFDRHVLSQPGVRFVVIMEGINDIGMGRENPTPTAEDLIAAHKQLVARAHARGLTIYGATLTPYEGASYYTDVGEAKRQAVNEWIRTSGAYDAVFDFDALARDPNDPTRFHPDYHPGDYLHPNDTGYGVMADAIELALFR